MRADRTPHIRVAFGALLLLSVASVVPASTPAAPGGAPKISGFSPTSGRAGTIVTIAGSNLTGATAVAFNKVAATTYTVVSTSQIKATDPAAATSGRISVTTPAGRANSGGSFTVTRPPTISASAPPAGPRERA